jgi:hypothetical protein
MAEAWFFLISLIYVSAAAAVLFGLLRLRDQIVGVQFETWLRSLEGNPVALSIWLSAWVLGLSYLVATAIS